MNCSHEKLQINDIKVITSIYRSPSTCPVFICEGLDKYLTNNSDNDINILIGDINIIIKNKSETAHNYCDLMAEKGYKSLINEYTRVSTHSEIIILKSVNHMFLKACPAVTCKTVVYQSCTTDHYTITAPVRLDAKYMRVSNIHSNRTKSRINYKKLQLLINTQELNAKMLQITAEEGSKHLILCISQAISIATTHIPIPLAERKRKSWITPGLIKSINTKQELYTTWKLNPKDEDAREAYNKYKNQLSTLLFITKNNYYQNKITACKGSNKELWKTTNISSGDGCKANHIKEVENDKAIALTNTQEIANEFDQHYVTVGQKMASKLKSTLPVAQTEANLRPAASSPQ